MGNYRIKDPTPLGREFILDKFNKKFNLNINYQFFKEKLDQLKRKYKKYKELMKKSTGISVDTTTSVISASNSWWQKREVCKIIKSFKRNPPEIWDVMQRCFILYEVHSQPQFSVNQRREQLMNDGLDNDEGHIPTSRIQQRGGLRRGSSSQRGAGNSQISTRISSRGSRRKQSFETTLTDTITGLREFQRQSLQQMCPNCFDEDDYNEFDMAMKIFESMDLPNDTDFYWACIHAFKEEIFWRKYFINTSEKPVEDKLKFLQALTGYTRDNEYVGKRQWGHGFQQWGTPPTAPQWNSPSNVPQWTISPTAPQWGTPSSMPQWSSSPTAPQLSSPPTIPQWNSPSNAPQWRTQQNVPQWSSPSNAPQWRSSQNAPQYIPPTNVQRGFLLGTEEEITTNAHQRTFERGPIQTDSGLGWRNIWRRVQEDSAAYLQLLRMSLDYFRSLCDIMETSYGLQPTLNVSIEESVAMFLRICGHNEVQRDVGLRFGRTQETLNRKFFEVLKTTELLACDYIKTPTTQELRRIPEKLQMDRRYWPYFSGFVGPIDGVHVCVKVKPELQGMYWNRHDRTSFNIMAICDINMFGMEHLNHVTTQQF
ncbi:unnamed protein product [Arabidopsis thaliana]|uniref:Uncharacterized protein n=1 Tax=Arabidopsis thaliana TaxID=3702 RepID=A0A654FCB4_ARATH|nr:unnamed protein product [Arabidopsis thaliana]